MIEEVRGKTAAEALAFLESGEGGLSSGEVQLRSERVGLNILPEPQVERLWHIFLRQFRSPLIYALVFASVIVLALGDIVDGLIIFAVLVFNAIVGTIQEGRAQNTLRSLRKFVATDATVFRDGKEVIVSSTELVPGDVIMLDIGQKIPADARILSAHNLKLNESLLTGESEPNQKVAEPVQLKGGKKEYALLDEKNIVFRGTHVVAGDGRALVVATGTRTAIGKISLQISSIDTEIPLKGNIRRLAQVLIGIALGISVILFISGVLWFGKTPLEMFKLVVALSVSFIPEGLPVALTLTLVSGVWRMARRNALVKKLQAVEALGQAKVIAVDKTGTVTRNELAVQKVLVGEKEFSVTGSGYEPVGSFFFEGQPVIPAETPELLLAGKAAVFTANARVSFDQQEKLWRVFGDPTEAALLVLGRKTGFNQDEWEMQHPLLEEMPFDFRYKYRAVVRPDDSKRKKLFVMGAPEAILKLSRSVVFGSGLRAKKMMRQDRERIEEGIRRFSKEGLRVLAFGFSAHVPGKLGLSTMPPLAFGGLLGMKDVLRPEVQEAMRQARRAGIRVVMITGDHALTAKAIGQEAGIYREGDAVLTGSEIDRMSADELAERVGSTSVFARVSPEHKLHIIQAFRKRGEIIAMTGDGVNDAPSLVAADLGVAMGRVGTEVAKEAADIVLLDDNFGSIVDAIEEGRSIFHTIRKVLRYLFSTNIGEVLVISAALFLGMPLPLLAVQIIWLNFVTDGFLVSALALEPRESGLLDERRSKTKNHLVDGSLLGHSFASGLVMALGALWLFQRFFPEGVMRGQTIVLTVLALYQWFLALSVRSERRYVVRTNPFSNPYLVGALCIVVALQMMAVYFPPLQHILKTEALGFVDWIGIALVASSLLLFEELKKWLYNRFRMDTR